MQIIQKGHITFCMPNSIREKLEEILIEDGKVQLGQVNQILSLFEKEVEGIIGENKPCISCDNDEDLAAGDHCYYEDHKVKDEQRAKLQDVLKK